MPQTADQADDHYIITSFKAAHLKDTAFTQLVTKYQERLYWHIRRMVITHEDTNDVLQNVFIKVWRNLNNFREESNLYTWLYRIATNETLSWLDQLKRHVTTSTTGNEDYMSERLTAQADFDPSKIEWKLQRAILTLPEKQRLVFNLRYYDEMPYEEMATLLGTSTGALKASYHHAVKKVEASLLSH
ncbi:MAG: sigma-70 family RNA polymerase sigma factor [Taibaiella sp.]|nr:sigma-70 family RNA polymerase sigma factor [Taibaiella sp.]